MDLIADRPTEVPLVVSFGGGANSTAMLVGLNRYRQRPDLITFADTGGEKPETYAHLASVNEWCERIGFPPIITVKTVGVRVPDTTLEEACLRLEVMPSRTVGLGTCALRWKIEPQTKFIRSWQPYRQCVEAGYKPIRLIGYDAGESHRAKITEDGMFRYAFPLIAWGWDRIACEEACQSEGLTTPIKSACFYCPSSRKPEVLWLSQHHPDLFARAVTMERAALASGKMHSVKGLGRHWSWEELVKASEADRAAMLDRPVEPCVVCEDGGCTIADDED